MFAMRKYRKNLHRYTLYFMYAFYCASAVPRDSLLLVLMIVICSCSGLYTM